MADSVIQLIIITGMSGAGKTTASHFFEDAGYFCMDNVPPALLPKFIQICLESNGNMTKLAVVIDARGGSFFQNLFSAIDEIKQMNVQVKILFLEASDNSLIRRFSETRRKHPLNKGGRVSDDIKEERRILEMTRAKADYVIDTSMLTGRELQEELRKFTLEKIGPQSMSVVFVSFGYKHGIPEDCDLIFDVRFLPNPFYVPELKHLTGVDDAVYNYVFSSKTAEQFAQRLKGFIEYQIPLFISEPKTRLQIGIGCTGGHHRSVAFAEYLFRNISDPRIATSVIHRDINTNN
ncbi:MAG: RNase adapter RapZ [Candidatus Riflebacteria bacterium]|nr:RNase adapter RapZ [Candidatus Riflebacteria bacterium]